MPDLKTKHKIFQIHTAKMSLNDDVKVVDLIATKDDLSGADIKAMCTEASLLPLLSVSFINYDGTKLCGCGI